MVARGRYGAFLNQTSKIWDNVAPQIIVEEAGAVGRRSTGRRSTIPAP
ncbi:inositol monophosphatase family protein [Nonomuraea sp. NBC_00507]